MRVELRLIIAFARGLCFRAGWLSGLIIIILMKVIGKFPHKSAVYAICRPQISLTHIYTIYAI